METAVAKASVKMMPVFAYLPGVGQSVTSTRHSALHRGAWTSTGRAVNLAYSAALASAVRAGWELCLSWTAVETAAQQAQLMHVVFVAHPTSGLTLSESAARYAHEAAAEAAATEDVAGPEDMRSIC